MALKEAVDSRASEFDAIVALYTGAFPQSERKPSAFLGAAVARSDYRLFYLEQNDQLLGFALVYLSPTRAFALLEYMAVADDARGLGHGGRLFRQVAGQIASPLLIEIEADEGCPPGAERTRRKQFYQRLGCRVIDRLDYLMPRVATTEPPAMLLMVHGLEADAVPRQTLRRWLGEVYLKVYDRPQDDPAIDRMLDALPELVIFEG